MENVFLKLLNMSLAASWLVLAVLVLRFALKKAPKWTRTALWALVAVRLMCPWSVESALSLIPSAEPVPPEIVYAAHPRLDTGIPALNAATAPVMESAFAPTPTESANPLQIWASVGAWLWLAGASAMLLYALVSYLRLRRRVAASISLEDGVFLCDGIGSPFILGVFRPRVYVPSELAGAQLAHVLAHERAHLARRDHWWKPLGFVLLAAYWFNPALWLAYILLCRDIELACDERVYRDMKLAERADYSQTLLDQSCSRLRVAACPLAFGEVGVKERVKAALSYKKPAFWVLLVAVAACVVVAVCFLTDPRASRSFPMDGRNVSSLNTGLILEKIARAEKLEDSSELFVNEDNFEQVLTPEFDWKNDGAIRFFYTNGHTNGAKTYSAQLRSYLEKDSYFITERMEWPQTAARFKLRDYLDALKYLPQEEIRRLAPDADAYSVLPAAAGTPDDYNRVLTYGPGGAAKLDGWLIHLEVKPMHEAGGGAYVGTDDEIIHVFYGEAGTSESTVQPAQAVLNDENLLSAELIREWEHWDALDAVTQSLSSSLPGHLVRQFTTWAEGEAYMGGTIWNPLEDADWLVKRNFTGADVPSPQTGTIQHAMLSWGGSRDGTVDYAELSAGYSDGEVRVVFSADFYAPGFGKPEASAEGRVRHLALDDGTDVLCSYSEGGTWDAADLSFSRGDIDYKVRVISYEGTEARDRTMDQVVATLGGAREMYAEPQVGALIVQYDDELLGQDDLDALGEKYGFTAVRNFGRGDLFSAYFSEPLTGERANEIIAALNAEDGVVLAGILEPNLTDIMGFVDYSTETEELAPNHYLCRYIAELDGRKVQFAESFGIVRHDHIVDLDGDGVTELVCNCVYGGDGARRVFVYRRNGNVIERGSIDYDRLSLIAWNNWGVNSTAEWYDTMRGKIVVEYASLASSTMTRTFTREADYDAFVWEEFARLPE